MSNIFYSFLLLLCILNKSLQNESLSLNQLKKGSLSNDSYHYYELQLPQDLSISSENYLLLTLKQNFELDFLEQIVSNPFIYISQEIEQPNKSNNKWNNENFGKKIISINSKYLKSKFYISIYCKFKCNYILNSNINITQIINSTESLNYKFNLNSDETIKLQFTSRSLFSNLYFQFIGSSLSSYKTYISEEDSNIYLPYFPIFYNGYKYNIQEGKNFYKTNQTYEILIQNNENPQTIEMRINYDIENIEVKEFYPLYDQIQKFSYSCYFFNLNKNFANEDIKISFSFFNGGIGILKIGGYSSVKNKTSENDESDIEYYELSKNELIILNNVNYNIYYEKNGNQKGEKIYFCYFAKNENTSLIIKMNYFDNYQIQQKYNYILPNITEHDIIPKNTIAKYQLKFTKISLNDFSIRTLIKKGNINLYAYFSNNDEEITTELLTQYKKNFSLFQPTKKNTKMPRINIPKEKNKCLENNNKENKYCELFVIFECLEKENCVYDFSFLQTNKENIVSMLPRNIYTNIIKEFNINKYKITITDANINNIIIVLTENSGKVKLTLKEYISDDPNAFIPKKENDSNNKYTNIIEIKSSDYNINNLKGTFYFDVEAYYFSAYSIYYYEFNSDESNKIVSSSVTKGEIIKDYFTYNNQIKIYEYSNLIDENKSNNDKYIYVTSNDNVKYDLYILNNLDNISIRNIEKTDYVLKNNENNNILFIKQNFIEKYLINKKLYVLVTPNDASKSSFDPNKNYQNIFYFGITDQNTPFLLKEGMDFKMNFSQNIKKQKFLFKHLNIEKDIKLSISVPSNKLKLYIDINNIKYSEQIITGRNYIQINSTDIKQKSLDDNNSPNTIGINFESINDYISETEFKIAILTSSNIPITITDSDLETRQILDGEIQYFILDTRPDAILGIKLSSFVKYGKIEIYAKKISDNEDIFENYPDEDNFEYKSINKKENNGEIVFMDIPINQLRTLKNCRFKITIKGINTDIYSSIIEYSILLSTEITEIVTNRNYNLHIINGQIKYFRFLINKKPKKLFISMTNKDKRALLYLNYGKIPTINKYQWKSKGYYNEYLDVSINDNFFEKKNNLEGDYFLIIVGLGSCSYNLYISTEDIKLIDIDDDNPGSCTCNMKNDTCYFRYGNINDLNIKKVGNNDIIFYVDYIFGSAELFGKLYSSGGNDKVFKDLPSKNNKDYFNNRNNNFIKVSLSENLSGNKYKFDSIIIVVAQCSERSLLNFYAIKKKGYEYYSKNNKNILSMNKNNYYYLSAESKQNIKFLFFSYKNQIIQYKFKAFNGQINTKVYYNISNSDKYEQLSQFTVNGNYMSSYINRIITDNNLNKNILFEIETNLDCFLFINLRYEDSYVNFPISTKFSVRANNEGEIIGYFDFVSEIDDVFLIVSSEKNYLNANLEVYTKMNIFVNKTDIKDEECIIPSENNYDILQKNNPLTGIVGVKIKNIEITERKKAKIVRIFIKIKSKDDKNEKINIYISPNVNHLYRMTQVETNKYYFLSLTSSDTSIYKLVKNSNEDNCMIIEILSGGENEKNIRYLITEEPQIIDYKKKLFTNSITPEVKQLNGKSVLYLSDIKDIPYYLYIWVENSNEEIKILLYYYSITQNLIMSQFGNLPALTYNKNGYGKISIEIKEAINNKLFNDEKKKFSFYIIITDKKEKIKYLNSVLDLSDNYREIINDINPEKFDIRIQLGNNNIILVNNLVNEKEYYLNLVQKDNETGNLIIFKSITVIASVSYVKQIIAIIIFLVLFIISFVAVVVYRKMGIGKILRGYGTLTSENKEIPRSADDQSVEMQKMI